MGVLPADLFKPTTDSFVARFHAPFRHHLLRTPIAQAETEVQPRAVPDDRREAVGARSREIALSSCRYPAPWRQLEGASRLHRQPSAASVQALFRKLSPTAQPVRWLSMAP